jgi:hypothetical protein
MLGPQARTARLGRIIARPFTACAVVGFMVAAALLVVAAAAETDPRVAEFLASINKSITELSGRAQPQASSICGRLVASAINMDAVTDSALGHIPDRRLTVEQRAAYRAAAQRWAVRDCLRRNQDNGGNPLEFLGVRSGERGERLLATRSSEPAHTVIWRLSGSGPLRAVDIVVDGRSMSLALRDETKALIDRNNGDIDLATAMLGR